MSNIMVDMENQFNTSIADRNINGKRFKYVRPSIYTFLTMTYSSGLPNQQAMGISKSAYIDNDNQEMLGFVVAMHFLPNTITPAISRLTSGKAILACKRPF